MKARGGLEWALALPHPLINKMDGRINGFLERPQKDGEFHPGLTSHLWSYKWAKLYVPKTQFQDDLESFCRFLYFFKCKGIGSNLRKMIPRRAEAGHLLPPVDRFTERLSPFYKVLHAHVGWLSSFLLYKEALWSWAMIVLIPWLDRMLGEVFMKMGIPAGNSKTNHNCSCLVAAGVCVRVDFPMLALYVMTYHHDS